MSMPWQLREGLKRRVKGAPPRPIVEQLPAIAVHHLKIPDLYDEKVYTLPNVSLRWSFLAAARLSREAVEFHIPSLHRNRPGPTQTFGLKPVKVGYGIRYYFLCDCGRPVVKLYFLHRRLACRLCHHAVNSSQILSRRQRPILQASRIESYLNGKPGLYKHTKERLTKRLGEKLMLAQRKLGTRTQHGLLD